MILDALPLHMAATIRSRPNGKLRLTLDFPDQSPARDRVLSLLADLLRPDAPMPATTADIEAPKDRC